MIWLTSALAAPVVHPTDTYVLAVGGDPHADYQHRAAGSDSLARYFNSGTNASGTLPRSMGANAFLLLGDLVGDRSVDLNGDRVVDCTVDRVFSSTCEYPSPWSSTLYTNAYATYGAGKPVWALAGNHDGNPPIPGIVNLDEPNEWWRRTLAPMSAVGLADDLEQSPSHQAVRVTMPSGTWDILLVHSWSWMQDRAHGGRCDIRDWTGLGAYATCSTRGWPAGVITTEQIVWLEVAIARAEAAGRHVLIATHQPPPHTTVLTGAPGEAHAEVCPGIRVHSTDLESHFPRDADLLPARTDLDGVGNPREVAHDWASSLLRWEGDEPDLDWGVDLVRRHPGVVRLWVSAHNHLPVPDLTYAGRGVRFDDAASGTTWLAHGPLTSAWCTTNGACRQQGARLELHGNGTWSWERWALQSSPTALPGCTTNAVIPTSRPGPWGGLPIETGG